jgi:ATP-dependent Lon protease
MRAGIKQVIVPKRNEKDMPEIPEEVKKGLKWHFVENVDQVMQIAIKDVRKTGKAFKPAAPAGKRAKARRTGRR